MNAEPNNTPPPPPAPGLPPVTPPSGRFIAQLFLVPGTIVFVAVLLLMMFHNLFGGSQTPAQILRHLDDGNPDIRWRAASDLANTLERSESQPLRSDPHFALELVERLRRAIDELDSQKSSSELEEAKGGPTRQQRYVSFLTVAVARLNVPLAAALLSDLVRRPDRPDDAGFVRLRRQALFALSILGDNVQKFPELPEEQRAKILDALEQMAGEKDAQKSVWGQTALYYLDRARLRRITGDTQNVVRADLALAVAARADDPFARRLTAFALRFWKGEPIVLPCGVNSGPVEATLIALRFWKGEPIDLAFGDSYDVVEATLAELAHDDGHGKMLKLE